MGDDTTAISWHDAEAMKPYLQNQTRLAALGVAGVLIFGGWTLSARADSTLRNAMQAQREYFLTNYSPRLQTNVQSAVWLNTFLSDLGTSAERPQPDWVVALRRLVSLGKQEDLFYKNTGYVEDVHVLEVVIGALKETDRDARDYAVETLAWHTRDKDLASFAKVIKKSLVSPGSEDELLLLGRLPLDKDERREALAKASQLVPMRIRLGDAGPQKELIESFKNETNYFEKARLARLLGYAGTHACAEALVDGLRSEVSTKGRYDDRSIRVDVLLALGQIYQDEMLFTRDARLLADNSDVTFDQFHRLATYIEEVNAWAQKNFGHPAWENKQVWFIKFLNIPRIQLKKP